MSYLPISSYHKSQRKKKTKCGKCAMCKKKNNNKIGKTILLNYTHTQKKRFLAHRQ